jgi:hypothetical protein
MGASKFFQNFGSRLKSQTPRGKHKHYDDHDQTEGWKFPRNTTDHHKASGVSTEPIDKKTRLSTSIEKK